ncbi:MAG: hypothetical protein SGPRY_004197, partial [Prymnesium sp.]
SRVVIVLHDAKADLGSHVRLNSLFDTQVAHEVLRSETNEGLAHVVQHWLGVTIEKSKRMLKFMKTPHPRLACPLHDWVLASAADDVRYLPQLYSKLMEAAATQGVQDEILAKSQNRLAGRKKALKNTALAFMMYLNDDTQRREEAKLQKRFRSLYVAWRAEEQSKGSNYYDHYLPVLYKLIECKLARKENGVISFDSRERQQQAAKRVESSGHTNEKHEAGIIVSAVSFPDYVHQLETVRCELRVSNTGQTSTELSSASLVQVNTSFSLESGLPSLLNPGSELKIALQCSPRAVGMHYDTLSLFFRPLSGKKFSGKKFRIDRSLRVSCGDEDLLDKLKPTTPFKPTRRQPFKSQKERTVTIPAPPIAGDGGSGGSVASGERLGRYPVPSQWHRKVLSGEAHGVMQQLARQLVDPSGGRTVRLYQLLFQKLLWSEELQLGADLRSFDLVEEKAVDLAPMKCGLFSMRLEGLAEKRPSVLKGDILKINRLGRRDKVWMGRAEQIEMEDVLMRLNDGFVAEYLRREKVEVRFVLGRTPLRLFHQGLSEARHLEQSFIFPPAELTPSPRREHTLHMSNGDIQSNERQREAVCRILEGEGREVPYIIFGPPGTGKTTTVVEAIIQCSRITGFNILVCAPTNTAADQLCSRLRRSRLDKCRIIRFISFSRSRQEVPPEVLEVSNWDASTSSFSTPSLEQILSKSIVITTLSTSGRLFNLGVQRGHFNLVVIDEAGQALEPEAAAPLCTLLGPEGQLVLAGDPKQLGPVIHNAHAAECGLATSLLERLMREPIYQRGESGQFNPLVLTKLTRNFRSHEVLLKLPNSLFYENELHCCADLQLCNHCNGPTDYNDEPLATGGRPLKFHGIVGEDMREDNSPSWFNPHECLLVLNYVRALRDVKGKPIRPGDIGVITTYHKQAQKITRLLKREGFEVGGKGIKVGSTELFQGQERKVIIISTVRSSANQIENDQQHNLGFLKNPKRFNVATTRACSLMIIIGNPHILATDYYWRQLLRLAIQMGAYAGEPPPSDPLAVDASLIIGENTDASDLEGQQADRLNESVLDASKSVEQEGIEMPTWT